MKSRTLMIAAVLGLSAGIGRLTAQTVVPFDLSHVTVALYQGDGTSIDTGVTYDYTTSIDAFGGVVQQVGFVAGPDPNHWSNPFEFNTEIDFSNGPGRTEILFNIYSILSHPLANYDEIVISGLFPEDPNYEFSGILYGRDEAALGFYPLQVGTDVFFDGAAGTLTIDPQITTLISYVNIWFEGQLTATEVSAIPEPLAAAAVLALGAAGFVVGRRVRAAG